MAYYKPVLRRTKDDPGKWYPMAVSLGRVTTDDLCDEIAESTTVSHADVLAVLKALNRMVGRHLAMGQTVQLKGLCNARLTIKCGGNGVATPGEVGAEQINGYRVVFAAEHHKRSGGKGRCSTLDMGHLRWEPAPDFFKESDTPGNPGIGIGE